MSAIYIHVPFCATRCIYCDFYSTTSTRMAAQYVDAVISEMQERRTFLTEPIRTIYLGGGTPSQLPPALVRRLLVAIGECFDLSQCEEVTMEANPEDIASDDYCIELLTEREYPGQPTLNCPVNRFSMGVQSMVDDELELLHRRHDASRVRKAVERLRASANGLCNAATPNITTADGPCNTATPNVRSANGLCNTATSNITSANRPCNTAKSIVTSTNGACNTATTDSPSAEPSCSAATSLATSDIGPCSTATQNRCLDPQRGLSAPNISLDLMYGLPTQTIDSWRYSIAQILELRPQHISAYNLSVEAGTRLRLLVERGELEPCDDDTCLAMAQILRQELRRAGYEQYEISNYALPGYHSRHNSSYWVQTPYLGLGPGAHSYDGQCLRTWNAPNLSSYLKGMRHEECEHLTRLDLYNERVMLGLRTATGVPLQVFAPYAHQIDTLIDSLQARRLVHKTTDHLILTEAGLALADEVIRELMLLD